MNDLTQKTETSFDALPKILVMTAVFICITFWAAHRTTVLLNGTLERTVARQAADLSVIAEERFDRELGELSLAASAIPDDLTGETTHLLLVSLAAETKDEAEHRRTAEEVGWMQSARHAISVGIVAVDGSPIIGGSLSRWDFLNLPRAFRGQSIVDFCAGRGLLFAVPIMRDGNVRAVLYRLYGENVLAGRFTLTDYHPAVRLLLRDKLGNLILPCKNYGESDQAFFNDIVIREAFARLREQLGTRRSAAMFVELHGKKSFVFASDLPQANCTVAGYIPWSAVAGDIALIHERLLRSIGILFLIFFFFMVQLYRKHAQFAQLSVHAVEAIAEAIDAKDSYTKGHSDRVANYAREIGRRCGYSQKHQDEIYMMGLLHDVGKIGISDAVINKPGKLTDEEFAAIKTHPVIGWNILSKTKEMNRLAMGARWHHERFDGDGYPDKLSQNDIPEEARIIAVADAYDAMTSRRSYRDALPQAVVRKEIEKGKGTQFDPKYADVMLKMIDEDHDYRMRDQ